jgi:hypothetical protein
MVESLVLVEDKNVDEESLRSLSLQNAKQVVIGSVPGGGVVLHVAATTSADLSRALVDFAKVPKVTQVTTLTVRNSR